MNECIKDKPMITRKAGHPWDGKSRPNFDFMEFVTDSQEKIDSFVLEAKKKFWQIWAGGGECTDDNNQKCFAVFMYKPSGIKTNWTDDPKNPHPGGID